MKETFRVELKELLNRWSIDAYVGTPDYRLADWLCERIEKHKVRIENAKLSQKKARANGTKLGRPKIRNDIAIKNLRKRGHSLRDIASIVGVSTAAVQRSINEEKHLEPKESKVNE